MPEKNGGPCIDESGRGHLWEKGISCGGQYGVVLQAQNLKFKKKVALKIIFIDTPSSDEDHQRVAECRTKLQKLVHKNVVQCHDLWLSKLSSEKLADVRRLLPQAAVNFPILSPGTPSVDDAPLPVIHVESELCSDNLRQYLKTSNESLFLRLEILFREIGSGLAFIHSQGVVHGSLKPENVLIHRYMEKGQRTSSAKLSDAGLTQISGLKLVKTASNTGGGIPDLYLAPEKLSGALTTSSVDIFGLGIILMELMHLKCNQDGDEFLRNSIQNLSQKRQFPADFKSDQFLNGLILDMTDKDVKKRPGADKILEIFDTTLRRNLNSWARYSPELENLLDKGDIIEINRTTSSHWGIYYGEGQLVHFHPIAAAEEKGAVVNFEKLVPAVVSISNLKEVAGICLIRLNNRPDLRAKPRPLKAALDLIKVLLNRPEFVYSLAYLNSEHFVTYVKFDGLSVSSQVMTNLKVFGQIRMHKSKNQEDIQLFNQLAFEQWMENSKVKMDKIVPDLQILEKGIKAWDDSKRAK